MQKIFTSLLLMFSTLALSAQIDITVGGTVTDANGDPVEGVQIFISTDSIGSSMYTNTVFTDADGEYSDAFTVDDNLTQGIVFFNMMDCEGFYVNETDSWFPGNTNLVVNFIYCDPAVICSADVELDALTGTLTAIGDGPAPYTYAWNTGETTVSISPNAPSTYCVTITNADGCEAVGCEYYDGGVVDTSCYVYLILEGQSPAGEYIIEANGSGIAPFTYEWSTGETTAQIAVTESGLYCVTMTDASGCTAVTCGQVNVEDCSATVSQTAAGGLLAYATGVAPFIYEWSTGETTEAIYPAQEGLYCVTVTDAQDCTAEACAYFYEGVDSSCYVTIIEVQNGDWLLADASGAAPFTYSWSTGNTESSIPINESGNYCVTITDNNGCTSSDCYMVSVADNFQVNGWVTLADSLNQVSITGYAYLIVYDETEGTLTAIDTVELQTTPFGFASYDFGTVPAGDYLVKAALAPDSPGYDNNLPTYYGNVLWWDEATTITIPTVWYGGFEINLIEGNNPGGPGFIGGLVSEGANFQSGELEGRSGDPIEGVSIILLDEMEQPVAYDYTDAEGYYEFPSLDWGTYKVVIEMMNHEQEYYWVTLSPENPSEMGLNFEVNESGISTGISLIEVADQLRIFPNPASNQVAVHVESSEAGDVQLMITDFTGRVLESRPLGIQPGQQQFELNISRYPAGVYLLNLQSGSKVIAKRFVKR